ncbi:MAG: SAM-dependent methyltransferase, partial [Caulobacterales bacterium]|nr:SAM-dependent methyltransferase [Caulobacterales bacterium]
MWNERYSTQEYVFGKAPSKFVMAQASSLAPNSKIYLPADGEGRNSCYLAGLGHKVYASDY